MTFDAGPPLYYLLLYAWRPCWRIETALRSLSLLSPWRPAGVYQLAREAVDRPAAVLSTLLFAFSP